MRVVGEGGGRKGVQEKGKEREGKGEEKGRGRVRDRSLLHQYSWEKR